MALLQAHATYCFGKKILMQNTPSKESRSKNRITRIAEEEIMEALEASSTSSDNNDSVTAWSSRTL